MKGAEKREAGGAWQGCYQGKVRLLVVAGHPIQYQAPLYRKLAQSARIDLQVVFLSDFGIAPSFDPGFGQDIRFDVSLVDGFEHSFLRSGCIAQPSGWIVPPVSFWSGISKRTCDAVLVHGYANAASWLACVVAASRGVRYLMRGDTAEESRDRKVGPKQLAKRAVVGPLLRHAYCCLAIGKSNTEFYRSYGVPPGRITTAPFSVDNDFFRDAGDEGRDQREARLRSLKLEPSLPTLLYAGKLQPHKRPVDLLAAAGMMHNKANVIIIGDGPLRPAVEAAARDVSASRVLGFVNQSEIGQWYGVADVIVLPSSHEPWGLVVNEAMAAGAIPVVSSAAGCGRDLVRPGIGAVYPVGNVKALAECLDEIVSGAATLQETRAHAREVVDEYSLCHTVEGIERALGLATWLDEQ